ncbi:[protein-PII] uridylyltransferase [Mycobacteroides franklinii]|uniref:Bifunctional uridylyltransferase/uridylyl-removing enzyme n=1 Tax=Mycobacteroides franklinii TaxID=948102 RepID=A0A1S1LBT7_9MYCO|nr:[protein-PII] uridylyltransferase [Mycobacteroides franklinii]OHU31646.1 [protein-PII] uridylyltransferase [Mycobacteroides franklinii]
MGAATDLVAARAQLLGDSARLNAGAIREAMTDLNELWLTTKAAEVGITESSGFAIVALGGLGRREMLPHSDLDLVLLHDDNIAPETLSEVADGLWYPLWDANIRLDHSVRTVADTLHVAGQEMSAALALLDARHIAGDAQLSSLMIGGVRQQWRSQIRTRLDELIEYTKARWRRSGEIAHRAEPDLKSGRGGLRDVQLLRALAIAQLTDSGLEKSFDGAHSVILDVRTELHRVAGRDRDQLLAQFADEIGAALRIGDRFDLARLLSDAARTISYSVDVGLRTAANSIPRRGISALRRTVRRPLDEGVVEHAGEVVLARDARPERDPSLILRVAAASATTGLPISASTLGHLAESAPELRTPWPREALKDLLVLLEAGRPALATIEALDRTGLWSRLFPEWGAVRDLPPRDIVHIWTVDRHLVEAVVQASAFTTRVSRPDLLVLGALVHDIGKGRGGDHSVVGAELAVQIGTRLGLWPSDVDLLSKIVRYHLLLPNTATRRDLADPETIETVVNTLGGDLLLLELLQQLAEADSLATGPGVWGDWKASLIGELVRKCRMVMRGEQLPEPDPIDPELLSLAADGGVQVRLTPGGSPHMYSVSMIAPDQRGLLFKAAGVLSLNSLRVFSASVASHAGSAINTFEVSPRFGSPPAAGLLRQQLISALDGDTDIIATLDERERESAQFATGAVGDPTPAVPTNYAPAPPRIRWFEPAGNPDQQIVEIRTSDAPGLLARIAATLERHGVDIAWARVNTLGSSVVDTFCLSTGPEQAVLEAAIASVLPAVAPEPKKAAAS